MTSETRLTWNAAETLARAALQGAGMAEAAARSLARATLSAHRHGRPEVGFAHLLDYLGALKAGRIDSTASPVVTNPLPALWRSDAQGGIAQLGFDLAFDRFVSGVQAMGISIFTQHNSFTTGELGDYVRRLASEGLVALAFTNANAFMAPAPGRPKVYSTNPMAFAFPLGKGRAPVVIDQSSSATAFVNIASAARRGVRLDPGIAVDAEGRPTIDPMEAIRGALLPFGGRKGANLALMVELLAAGLAGGSWSEDMPSFQSGGRTLDAGLTVIAMLPGEDAAETEARAADFAARLKARDIYVPGTHGDPAAGTEIVLDADLLAAVEAFVEGSAQSSQTLSGM